MTEINLEQTVTIQELIQLAQFLKSEYSENKEYDRGLLELVTNAARISQNDRTLVADLIGMPDYIHRTGII
jgi:hypothetical protein